MGMALYSLPFPGSVTTSSAASLKSPVLTVLAKCHGFLYLFRSFFTAHPQSKLHSQKCTSQHRPTDLCLVSPVPPGQLTLPCSSLCSPVDKSAKQAAQVGFAAHRLLDTLLQAALGSQSVSEHWNEFPGQHLEIILQTQKKKEKLLLWVILRRDLGLSKLPSSHGSGITAYDESSLLTVHHKTVSEILCPKLHI